MANEMLFITNYFVNTDYMFVIQVAFLAVVFKAL